MSVQALIDQLKKLNTSKEITILIKDPDYGMYNSSNITVLDNEEHVELCVDYESW